MLKMNYVKPELLDFNASVRGEEEASCFIDCSSDSICPDNDDEI